MKNRHLSLRDQHETEISTWRVDQEHMAVKGIATHRNTTSGAALAVIKDWLQLR